MYTWEHGPLRLDWHAPTRALVSWKGRTLGELEIRLQPAFEGFDFEVTTHPVTTALGEAHRTLLRSRDPYLRLDIRLDAYPAWPAASFMRISLTNETRKPLTFSRFHLPALSLERQQPLWTMQAAAVHWGQDFAFPLPSRWHRANFLGHVQHGEGGGIPVVDFWSPQGGLALAHVEPRPHAWYMPVWATSTLARVALTPVYQEPWTLNPGQTFTGLYTLLLGHDGDFFAALDLYRRVLQAQGLRPPAFHPQDYEPAWCSWGYEFDVRPQEVLGVLPMLERLGISWVTLDDRWFDFYGDWQPRPDTFPQGEADMRRLTQEIHRRGMYAQLWWYPLCVEDGHGQWDGRAHQVARLYREHPDWVVRNPDGSVARNNRGLAMLCPALPQVRALTLEQARRFLDDWGFDGFKLDNIYTMPPCYHPEHPHDRPEASVDAFARLYREITTLTRRRRPHGVVQICPCGTPLTFSLIPATTQTVTADPTGSLQVRQRIKFYKALMGPEAPVFADHVELTESGRDFASLIGPGGIPGTKFVWPEDSPGLARLKERWVLDEPRQRLWERWFRLYREHQPARGHYLNLYDLAFDAPEGHAIRRGRRMYYAFFGPGVYQGPLELRGLEPGRVYRVVDYVHQAEQGRVTGPTGVLEVTFHRFLLIYAEPWEGQG